MFLNLQKLWVRLSDGPCPWTKPFSIDEEGSQTISMPLGTIDSTVMFVSVTRVSGSQKQVKCVCERERERETMKQTEREGERKREGETERACSVSLTIFVLS